MEFSKLQNLATVMSAADETPLELSILSTKVGNVRDRPLHANQPSWALICTMTGSQPTWPPTLWFNTRDRSARRPNYAADAHKRVCQVLLFFPTVPRSLMLHSLLLYCADLRTLQVLVGPRRVAYHRGTLLLPSLPALRLPNYLTRRVPATQAILLDPPRRALLRLAPHLPEALQCPLVSHHRA